MAAPTGATHYMPITSNPAKVPANMPDGGVSVFAGDLVIDEAASVNWEGGAESFIDGLAADYSDLKVTKSDGETNVPFGVKQFSQVGGSRKLILGQGLPELSASAGTIYNLYRGCTGGPFEDKAGVVPTADGYVGYWPLEEDADGTGTADLYEDWSPNANHGDDYVSAAGKTGQVGDGQELLPGPGARVSGDHIRIAADPSLDAIVAVGMWFKSHDDRPWYGLMDKYVAGDDRWIVLANLGDKFPQCIRVSDGAAIETDVDYRNDQTWHHVMVVWTGAFTLMYIDGVVQLDTAVVNLFSDGAGGFMDIGGYWFVAAATSMEGFMDEAQLFSVPPSADRVLTIFNCESDNDAFWTVGAEQEISPVVPPLHLADLQRQSVHLVDLRRQGLRLDELGRKTIHADLD